MAMQWRTSQVTLDVAIAGTNGEPFAVIERPGVGLMVLVKQQADVEGPKSSVLPGNEQGPPYGG